MTGEADFKTEIITPLFQASTVRVEHDAPAALAGATLGAPGIIVVAGTGSVVFGENAPGRDVRTGGWGYVFGDEGSGFGLAREAVRAGLDALDGVGPETSLVPVLTARFGVTDLRLMPMVMYNGHLSRDAWPRRLATCSMTWQAGDAVAAQVVTRGSMRWLVAHTRWRRGCVCRSTGVPVGRRVPFATVCRGVHDGPPCLVPRARVEPARLSPAAGAVLLAFRPVDTQ